mmetsp:Transcript_16643/g.53867  ORF Transcript_16643/g.53867 Transcript_16643/m.53867 type:complete len:112 (+) Transcript_16643:285-620(+)
MLSFVGKSFLPEQVANTMTSNPMMTYGTLFGMNIAAGKLINTGAFEVTYAAAPGAAPEPCWSKLETGRFPSLEELKANVASAAAASPRPGLSGAADAAPVGGDDDPLRDEL